MKVDPETLKFRQQQPLDVKIKMSLERIEEWYKHWEGNVHVSFSGGKDSTALLHLVRTVYPEVPGVFVDTGLEYPEVKAVVRQFDNVERLRPEMGFAEVISKYGWPVVSKNVAKYVHQCKHTKSADILRYRLAGMTRDGRAAYSTARLPEKWRFLMRAPFEVSDRCCDIMKKKPFARYEKKTRSHPMSGTMAGESKARWNTYLQHGCNNFTSKTPMSKPLSFWGEQDILKYIKDVGLPLAKVYGEIKRHPLLGDYELTGTRRTGCMFCAFGVHLEKHPNRFEQMKETHPKHWDYVINRLGLGEVLDFIGVPYGKELVNIL